MIFEQECNSHMTRDTKAFVNMKSSFASQVKLGNGM